MTDPEPTASCRSIRPGAWFGIFGEKASLLLPPSEKRRVASLWEVVDDGADFDEVLDALLTSGLRHLPGFVLVSENDGPVRVVLRGAVRATFWTADEELTLEGSSAATWVEQSLEGVVRCVIEVEEAPAGGELTVPAGLVRVARVATPPPSAPATGADLEDPLGSEDSTGFEAVTLEPEPTELEESTAAQDVAASLDWTPDDEPQTLPEAEPLAEPGVEHDGMTQAGGWNPQEDDLPGLPGQDAPGVVPTPVARLELSSGESVEVDRAVLVGRAPVARRSPSTEQPRLVRVPSPHQEISSTHLEVRPGSGADHGSAVVTDLGSTNGTVLVQPGLPPEELQPGIAVQLMPGAVLDLGDGVTIEVADP